MSILVVFLNSWYIICCLLMYEYWVGISVKMGVEGSFKLYEFFIKDNYYFLKFLYYESWKKK